MRFSDAAVENILLNGVFDTFGNSNYDIYLYSGAPVGRPEDAAPFAQELAQIDPSFGRTYGPASNGQFAIRGLWERNASVTGVATWFRLRNSFSDSDNAATDQFRIDGSVSDVLGDIVLPTVSLVDGVSVSVDELIIDLRPAIVFAANMEGALL